MRSITLIISIFLFVHSFSQGFKVKEFKQNLSDGSAFHAPIDADGNPCGLIKVRTDDAELKFKGTIVGEVENKMNEYWVYMSQGSKSLNITHPHFMPISIAFADYGIEISPKATYILTLTETKYKKEKTGVAIVVKPEKAELHIDDILVDNLGGNGFYQLYLPKGTHICKLSKLGYRTNVQAIQVGKVSQTINVELESVMAELELNCKTTTAELYVDDEFKGNGTWKGNVLPGEHQIEVRQKNYISYNQSVSLAEKECRSLSIQELKRSEGKLSIETTPSGVFISVDGIPVGTSPCKYITTTGHHIIKGESYGCQPALLEIDVDEGDNPSHSTMVLKIVGNSFFERVAPFLRVESLLIDSFNVERQSFCFDHKNAYTKAYLGEERYIKELSIRCLISGKYDKSFYKEAFFWMKKLPNLNNFLVICNNESSLSECIIEAYCEVGNPEKALELLRKQTDSWAFHSEIRIIGDAFFKKKEYDKAKQCFEEAEELGYEGLGDCYAVKGDKQRAVIYYRKYLQEFKYDDGNRIEKKLKDLGYK